MIENNKMKIEVWSDVACPFCYIGKRHYESAISKFADANNIELEWKSFQLDPAIPEDLNGKQSVSAYLSASKGMTLDQVAQMTVGVTEMAKNAGLSLDFEKAVAANTFNAHRIIQKAKTKGLGDAIEEAFFKAHFVDGLDVADKEVLMSIGEKTGLSKEEINDALSNDEYAYMVQQDIMESRNIGVRGVPFFVFNRKYGISGAQPVEVFTNTIEKSYTEWRKDNEVITLEINEGPACTTDGVCD